MPFKRGKKVSKKSTGSKRKFTKNSVLKISKSVGSGFPAQRAMKLRYCEYLDQGLTSGISLLQWNANSIFDPYITGTGHQPLGFDTWKEFYNHYAVISSKVKFTMTATNGGATQASILACAYLSDDVSVPAQITNFVESKRGSYKLIAGWNGMHAPTISSSYSAKKFFNIKDVKDNLNRIGAPVTADPADVAVFNLSMNNISGATIPLTIMAVIEYTVLFSEPKDLPQS